MGEPEGGTADPRRGVHGDRGVAVSLMLLRPPLDEVGAAATFDDRHPVGIVATILVKGLGDAGVVAAALGEHSVDVRQARQDVGYGGLSDRGGRLPVDNRS